MDHPTLPILLLFFPAIALAQFTNGTCSLDDYACDIVDDNLVELVNDVSSVDECRQACNDNRASCKYFTYFGPDSYPFVETCMLFSSCKELDPCTDCHSEALLCNDAYCTAPVQGSLGRQRA